MSDDIQRFPYRGQPSLVIPAARESFPVLRTWLTEIAASLRLPDRDRNRILVAADEVFTNIASYAYPPGTGTAEITVELHRAENALVLVFRDSGMPYNPLLAKDPDVTAPLAERKVGGLGVFMVKRLMDGVDYRLEDGRNCLTIRKKLPPPEGAR